MADEIKADYGQLEQVASRFGNQAQAVEEMTARIKAAMEKLENGGWSGRGANAFFAEMNGLLLPATQRLHDVLDDARQVVGEVARIMHQAEDEASSYFRNRF